MTNFVVAFRCSIVLGYYNHGYTFHLVHQPDILHLFQDEDGNYRITGRIKDMIIRGGENIYPREIEEFLYKLDGVKDVQVAGIPSKKYGEAVGAFIILQEGVQMQEADVRDFCRNKISRYKIPKYIFFVNEFPIISIFILDTQVAGMQEVVFIKHFRRCFRILIISFHGIITTVTHFTFYTNRTYQRYDYSWWREYLSARNRRVSL